MYIHVRVTAGAQEDKVKVIKEDHLAVSTREPAERNLANGRVVELVAQHLALPPRAVRIISGHHSPSKLLSVNINNK